MQSDQNAPGKLFDVWQVAEAILYSEGELHIDELTERIHTCGLTTLGLKGLTPRQTVCPVLLKHREVFVQNGSGYYKLRTSNVSDIRVLFAVEWLKRKASESL
jgi:hypothetical protein